MIPPRARWTVPPALTARWLGLGGLLLVEVLAFSLRFETPKFLGGCPWWAYPMSHSRECWVPTLLAVATVALLGGFRSWRARPALAGVGKPLAGHLAAVAAFAALTAEVCEGDVFAGRSAVAWVFGWYAAAAAVLGTWLAALRPDGWRGLLGRAELRAVAAGGLVAAGALASGRCSTQLWVPMARATLVVVRGMLGVCSSDVTGDPARCMIGVDGFTIRIAPACSGYEGIGLVGVFLAAYLAAARRSLRWPAAWALVPLGLGAIWLVNAARITALVLLGAWYSPAVAIGGFHSQAGSLGILAVCLGLVVLSRRARWFAARPLDDATIAANPTAAYLVPFLLILATTMATGAVSAGFDALYPLRIVAGGAALWSFRRSYPGRWLDGSWFAAGVGVLVFGLWFALEPANPAGARSLAASWAALPAGWGVVWLLSRAAGSAVVVPIAEELAFRGYLTRRLIAADFEAVPPGRFTWLSFLVSSAAFGALHGRWFAGTLAGLIYAGVYYRRGRVGDAALAHAVTNALIAAAVLATGDWTMWS